MNLSDYKYKTELHAHSKPVSACADLTPETVVEKYAELGYTSFVLSNHFNPWTFNYGNKKETVKAYINDYNIAKERGKELGLNVILGCEMHFCDSNNDFLLFGIDETILPDAYDFIAQDFESFAKWFRTDERLIIHAHPFRDGMVRVNPMLIDGIETFNAHPGHNSRISVAAQYAKKHDFIVTCGTDFHHDGHEGLVAMLTKKPITNSHELASVLKSRDYLFEMSGNIILPYGEL